jgi:hypothetical protein
MEAGLEGLFDASRYELRGKELEVSYTQVMGGVPSVTITDRGVEKHYTGTQVVVTRDPGLGRVVSVTTDIVFDGDNTTLSILLPAVNFGDQAERPVRTLAIEVVHKGHIGGPQFIDGQLATYRSIPLRGKARRIRG